MSRDVRTPLSGEVMLVADAERGRCHWARFHHFRTEPVLSYSFEAFSPCDADLAGGFWVDSSWKDGDRARGDLQWLGPDSPGAP